MKLEQDLLQVLRVAIVASIGKVPDLSDGHGHLLPAVRSFNGWLRKALSKSGAAHVTAIFKEFAADCRLCAISHKAVPGSRFGPLFNIRPLAQIGQALKSANRTQQQQDILVQLSYIGRALPKARPAKEGLKSQKAHLKALSSTAPPLPEGRRETMRRFAREWANDHLRPWERNPELDPSSGACLEYSRREGGVAGFLRDRLTSAIKQQGGSLFPQASLLSQDPMVREGQLRNWERKWPEIQAVFILRGQAEGFPISAEAEKEVQRLIAEGTPDLRATRRTLKDEVKITSYPVIDDDISLRAHSLLRDTLIKEFDKMMSEDVVPEAEVLTIAERGFKSRIVTKSPGCLVTLGHDIRRWLASGLRTDGAILEVLSGQHREAVESMLAPGYGILNPAASQGVDEGILTILSADLKTATDLIGRETYEALVEGILESNPGKTMPSWARRVFLAATGPQRLHYPDLGRWALSRRGALMGLPTTWPLLCLANLAWWHIRAGEIADHPPRVRICGDDLVAKASLQQVRSYEQNARDSGALFSGPSKHLISQFGGVFTEEIFFTTGPKAVMPEGPLRDAKYRHARRDLRLNLLERWSEAFPLRGIIGTMKSDKTGVEAPYWVALGPALEQLMLHRSEPTRRRLLKAVRRAHPELMKFATDNGVAGLIHVPRQFGGFGIPRANMWDSHPAMGTPGQRMIAFAATALAHGSNAESDLTLLSRPWQEANSSRIRAVAAAAVERGITSRYDLRKVTKGMELPANSLIYPGTVASLREKMEANVARDLFFLSTEPLVSRKLFNRNAAETLRNLRRRLAGGRRQLMTERGGWIIQTIRQNKKKFLGEDGIRRTLPPSNGGAQQGSSAPAPENQGSMQNMPFLTPEPETRKGRERHLGQEERGIGHLAATAVLTENFATAAAVEAEKPRTTWARLLKVLKEVEDGRIAVLRPGTERDISVPFETLEKIAGTTIRVSGQAGAVPLLNLPLREWPGRPTKQVFSHLFGPGGGE